MEVIVVGAGLAGCEAAYSLAERGVSVTLYEMKPEKKSPAHKSDGFAELVCSNSLKAQKQNTAAGMLKAEMRSLGSLLLSCADKCSVSAGGALAVDRDEFSRLVTEKIMSHKNIKVINREFTNVDNLGDNITLFTTGPLTSDALSSHFEDLFGKSLHFFDAASPIVSADSIDKEKVFYASRYNKGTADYINCGFDKDQYLAFYHRLISAQSVVLHDFEKDRSLYEGCMPVEAMAKRGEDALRFGPLKPVGIRHPITNKNYYAVVQLREENKEKTLYNLVGFQSNLTFSEQKAVFSMIPGLENAEFVRYGVMHRNTYLNSPHLLDKFLRLKNNCNIYFAGQITGCEGYMESAYTGIFAAINIFRYLRGKDPLSLPFETMGGAIINYITDETLVDLQPMGANMGLLPKLSDQIKSKEERYNAYYLRGEAALNTFKESNI